MYLAQWYTISEWQNRDSKYGSLMQTCTKTCSLYCFDSIALYFSAVNESSYKNNTQLFGLGQPQSLICSSSLFYNQKIRDQRSHRFTHHLLLTTEFWHFFYPELTFFTQKISSTTFLKFANFSQCTKCLLMGHGYKWKWLCIFW